VSKFRTRRERLDPEEVLAGSREVGAGELLDLIQAVNPSGRRLAQEEVERRYALKSRLQSLLVRRFGEQLAIRPEPGQEGLVALECRRSGRSGCHARLDWLDPDARAYVRRRLDEEAEAEPAEQPAAPAPAAAPDGAAGLLRAGEQALAAYDYDTARERFTEALAASDHGRLAAQALLSLLVDHLAADAEALALLPALSPEAAQAAEVRWLLGQAAARQGQDELALRLAQGLSAPRGAAIRARLARRALAHGEAAGAERLAREALEQDPRCPDAAELLAELAQRRAEERRPFEDEVERALCAGQLDRAGELAQALLVRWPDSGAARRALRAIDEGRRSARAVLLLHQAEAALPTDRPAARALAEEALALEIHEPADVAPRLRALLLQIAEAERAEEEQARVAGVRRLLLSSLEAGLLAYLGLEERLRAPLRGLPVLDLLEQVERARPDSPPRGLAEAALALLRARDLISAQPQAALDLIAEHARYLEHLPEARRLEREAQARHFEARQQAARAALQAIVADFEAATRLDPGPLLERVQALDVRALSGEEQQKAERMRKHLAHLLAGQRLAARVNEHGRADRLFLALEGADELCTWEEESFRRWAQDARGKILMALRERFDVSVVTGPGPPEELRDVIMDLEIERGARCWLMPSGREVLIPADVGRLLYLRVVSLESRQVVQRVTLIPPEELVMPWVWVLQREIVLLGLTGRLLRLSLPGFDVLRWHGGDDLGHPGHAVRDAVLSPDGRHLLVTWRPLDRPTYAGPAETWLIDTFRPWNRRVLTDRVWVGGSPALPGVMASAVRGGLLSVHERGAVAREWRFDRQLVPCGIAPGPGGGGQVLLADRPLGHDPDGDWDPDLRVIAVPEHGAPAAPQVIADSDLTRQLAVATASDAGLCFVRGDGQPPGRALGRLPRTFIQALRAAPGGGLAPAYRIEVPRGTFLVQDAEGRRAVALWCGPQGFRHMELLPEPARDWEEVDEADLFSRCLGSSTCLVLSGGFDEAARPALAPLRLCPPGEHLSRMAAFYDRHRGEPRLLAGLVAVMGQFGMPVSDEVLERLKREHLTDPHVRAWIGFHHVEMAEYDQGLALLYTLPAEVLPPLLAQHVYHARALAHLWRGEHDHAEGQLRAGRMVDGGACPLADLLPLAISPPDELTEADWGPGQPLFRQLAGALRVADECLERGDHAGARRAADHPLMWLRRELQLLARLAVAWLGHEPRDEIERQRKLFVLMTFVREWSGRPCSVPYRWRRWDAKALAAVQERVRDFLNDPPGPVRVDL
jgi:hypothetical protein